MLEWLLAVWDLRIRRTLRLWRQAEARRDAQHRWNLAALRYRDAYDEFQQAQRMFINICQVSGEEVTQ